MKLLYKAIAIIVVLFVMVIAMDLLVFTGEEPTEPTETETEPTKPGQEEPSGQRINRELDNFTIEAQGRCIFNRSVTSYDVENLTGQCNVSGDLVYSGQREIFKGSVDFAGFTGSLDGDFQKKRFKGEIEGDVDSGRITGNLGKEEEEDVPFFWIGIGAVVVAGAFVFWRYRNRLFGGVSGDAGGSAKYDMIFQDYFDKYFSYGLELVGGIKKDSDGRVVGIYRIRRAPDFSVRGDLLRVVYDGGDIFHDVVDSGEFKKFISGSGKKKDGSLNWLNAMRKFGGGEEDEFEFESAGEVEGEEEES
ncbi:MAG: hypothetical protein EF811_03850 [Methanonatronarchaeia archaeon]|nr:MAG: hypothetical protein EF811_03850 [Methanonatronarchaeia archaeon]